jgi:predicted nucleotidyltransferase component of viral defense system
LGYERAFLIQNMCPVTDKYIKEPYLDSFGKTVSVEEALAKKLERQAKKVLALVRQGKKLVFSDVLKIEAALTKEQIWGFLG